MTVRSGGQTRSASVTTLASPPSMSLAAEHDGQPEHVEREAVDARQQGATGSSLGRPDHGQTGLEAVLLAEQVELGRRVSVKRRRISPGGGAWP